MRNLRTVIPPQVQIMAVAAALAVTFGTMKFFALAVPGFEKSLVYTLIAIVLLFAALFEIWLIVHEARKDSRLK